VAFLKYRESDGYVVEISAENLQPEENYKVAESEDFQPGDEFEYYIKILEVDENSRVVSVASVRQSPPAQEILRRINILERELQEIKKVTL
jgi:hypothetical protein